MKDSSRYLIGQLARQAGVGVDTVRYYERVGLMDAPVRTAADYRVYGPEALRRLRFIKKAQVLGFSLDEIRRILNLHGSGRETCRCVVAMAEGTLAETERKLVELQRFRDALTDNLRRWKRDAGRPAAAEFCALIESTVPGRAGPGSNP